MLRFVDGVNLKMEEKYLQKSNIFKIANVPPIIGLLGFLKFGSCHLDSDIRVLR